MGKEIRINCITADYFLCHLCKVTVRRPVECSGCEQIFCYECLRVFLQNEKKSCPVGCLDARYEKVGHAFEKLMGFIYAKCKFEECQHVESIKSLWVHEKSCKYGKKVLEIGVDESVKQRDAFWMEILQKVITPSSQSLRVQNFVENSHVSFSNGCQQVFSFN